MKLTRRDFIHAGCAAGAVTLATPIARRAEAAIDSMSAGNPNRVTLNVSPTSWANLAKGFGFNVPPNIADSNGYPTSTPPANISANPAWAAGYTGPVVWKWQGRASMQLSPAAIIWSGGQYVAGVAPLVKGDVGGNFSIIDKSNPRVVFSFGYNIQNLSQSSALDGSGQHVIRLRTKPNYLAQYVGGTNTGSISGTTLTTASGANIAVRLTLTGSGVVAGTTIVSGSGTTWQVNIPQTVSSTTLQFAYPGPTVTIANQTGQAGVTGTWASHVVDAQNMDLVGTVWNPSDPYSGPSGHALSNLNGIDAAYILAQGKFSGFSNLVICKAANESLVDAGQITAPDLIEQYKYLMNHETAPYSQRGWLRFMDVSGVQGSYECDFANRMPAGYISYTNSTNYFPPAYWAGPLANSGGDAYTCSNPPASGSEAYADLEIVQGAFNTTNAEANPTLNVGGRGAAPIFDFTTNPNIFRISVPAASAGSKMLWTFSAPWLNGGAPYVFTYTTVANDTASVAALNGNLVKALIADTTLATAKVVFGNSGQVTAYPRTAQAGALTIAYTSGPAICTMTRIDPSTFTAGGTATLIYSQILGGWIYRAGGLVVSIPFEAIVELCNQVGAHCWFNWPVHTKGAFITAATNFFGDNTTGLTQGLRFGTEVGNELWNFSQVPFGFCQYLGCAMGFPSGGEQPQWSWGALRTVQYAAVSRAAWTGKGRSFSDHYILQMNRYAEAFANQNFEQYGFKGQLLTTSNSIYASYGGLGGGAGSDYSTSPNRPVDLITATGIAGYWLSDYIRSTSYSNDTIIFGTVSDNAQWLQAARDYANGLTLQAFNSLVSLFRLQRPGLDANSQANWTIFARHLSNLESVISAYDNISGRATNGVNPKIGILHYEGAPQWSFSTNVINGTNNASDSESLNALTYRIGNGGTTPGNVSVPGLNWDVSAYTLSGTNSASEMAQMCLNMLQGWKLDFDHTGAAAYTGSYKTMIKTYYYQALKTASAPSGRENHPAQFSYQNTTWGLFPVAYQFGNQYASYDAIHEWNA
jgi:hypothetical protein